MLEDLWRDNKSDIKFANALDYDFGVDLYDMIFLHPPYANIVKFSEKSEDLSRYSHKIFLEKFTEVSKNVVKSLKSNGYLILVCGNVYADGEEIPLGFYCSDILRSFGLKRKAVIVKDYGETKGGLVSNPKTKNLQTYMHLKNGTWEFCGDFIFVMNKRN
jgi:DNA modification methylase